MKATIRLLSAALCALALSAAAAAENAYTLGLRVGNGQRETDTAKKGGKGGGRGNSTQTKTITSSTTWPVTVSCRGAGRPSKLTLEVYYIGTHDGAPTVLKKEKIDVELDEKGDFRRELVSPQAALVKTTTRTQSGGGRGRRRGGNRGGGSVSVKTKSAGERVTGCIVQLLDGAAVAKSFVTNPNWSKAAKVSPLPEEEVLKFR